MLKQLVYVSEKTESFSGKPDLTKILDVARATNSKLGVTGVLLYWSGHFLQLLEGEPEALNSLYEKISKDPRHQNVCKVMEQEAETRIFADWSMAFRELHGSELDKFKKLKCWGEFVAACEQGSQISPDLLREVLIEFRYKAA